MVVKGGRLARRQLGGAFQRRRRLRPFRLPKRHEPDVEVRQAGLRPKLGHPPKLPGRLLEHAGLVERDTQIAMLRHSGFGLLRLRGRRRPARSLEKTG